ncbi:glutaredoxin family protein [Aeromonas sp. MR16]|uniref:glutaredoxin family protein n=1 Tax=Aeromonas sp. MR16 TaxID=2923420 RepID=UPI001F4BBD20|nr:glutaredoxin family protein [Aeromonas sp. MR16]MCH7372540.1 glutaredoxin family protein [Aeromonas sp. MR16]
MLTLFHTDGCHLCEQAWTLVEQAGLAARSRRCDILDDEEWLAAYRVRIPVLRDESGRELGWPFTLAELNAWVAANPDQKT